MTPEGKIKAKVKRALATLPKRYSFMPVQNGMGAPSLDFINCINGFFLAIETKTPGKQLTPRQKTTALAIRDALGVVYVIRDDMDISFMMGNLRRGIILQGMIYDALWAKTERTSGNTPVDEADSEPANDN